MPAAEYPPPQTRKWGRGAPEPLVACFFSTSFSFASAGGSISKYWRKTINECGALLIDNSSAFRMDPDVPLVVPEVNPEEAIKHQGLIANPNCTTILLVVCLAPLSSKLPIKRVVVSTYQSASGAGAMAMEELKDLSKGVLDGLNPKSKVLVNAEVLKVDGTSLELADKIIKVNHSIFCGGLSADRLAKKDGLIIALLKSPKLLKSLYHTYRASDS